MERMAMRSPVTIILVLMSLILGGPSTTMLARPAQSEDTQARPSSAVTAKPRKRALLVGVSK